MRNYRFNSPPPPRGAAAGRLLFPVIVLLIVAFGCGQYGVQLWMNDGLDVAWVTLALAGVLVLTAVVMLVVAIRAIRAGHRETEAARLRKSLSR